MNPFELKKLDGWDSLVVENPVEFHNLSEYSEAYRFICALCTKKYGKYTGGVTEGMKQTEVCDWCHNERRCVHPTFAGWPNMEIPKPQKLTIL